MEHQRLTGSNNDSNNSSGNRVAHYGSISLVSDPPVCREVRLSKCWAHALFSLFIIHTQVKRLKQHIVRTGQHQQVNDDAYGARADSTVDGPLVAFV